MSQTNGWIGRRNVLRGGISGAIALTSAALASPLPAIAAEPSPFSIAPDTALKRLLDGNQRFVRQRPKHPDQSSLRLKETAQSQHPFATLLSCADSRVPAEIVFDQGLGSIFDVRIAGNIVTPEALGSLEYATILLGSPLLMVLGHERCGAVTAAVRGESLPGKIGTFVKPIQPAIARVKDKQGDPVENAVVANVQYQIERLLKTSLLLARQVEAGHLKIVGGRYDLDTGEVTIVS
ncbi:MAG: carbonic anhydrase [Scytolyngbya sp. HA4215-MV1]|jgi:carbonic anhydrase|nr:carbonic anhydrase [Scytolyngbya sp. HA4215-MV1]